MKKRIVMLLSVVALMVVMLAMSVAPAFGAKPPSVNGCMVRGEVAFWISVNDTDSRYQYDRNGDSIICGYSNKFFTHVHYTDNNLYLGL
jgi:hypothetical protein